MRCIVDEAVGVLVFNLERESLHFGSFCIPVWNFQFNGKTSLLEMCSEGWPTRSQHFETRFKNRPSIQPIGELNSSDPVALVPKKVQGLVPDTPSVQIMSTLGRSADSNLGCGYLKFLGSSKVDLKHTF